MNFTHQIKLYQHFFFPPGKVLSMQKLWCLVDGESLSPIIYTPILMFKKHICIELIWKKCPHSASIETIYKGQTQWDHAQISFQNAKIKMFDLSLRTSMHKHILKNWFNHWNMELNCLMLGIHTNRIPQLNNLLNLFWIEHLIYIQNWSSRSMVCWPHIPTNWHRHVPPNWHTNWLYIYIYIYNFHGLFTLILHTWIFGTYSFLGMYMSYVNPKV
jgi:hypothetical protein